MSIYRKGKKIAISCSDLDKFKQEQFNEFQDKRITWQGEENVLVTTVLQRLYDFAAGKVQIVMSDTLPQTTEPNTQYWVKTYNGSTLEDSRFIIMTDYMNIPSYIGTSSADLTDYYTKTEVDEKLDDLTVNNFRDGVIVTAIGTGVGNLTIPTGGAVRVALSYKQDTIVASDQSTTPTDTDKLSYVNNTTNNRWTFEKIWDWIKGKITAIYYPVGSVIFNMGTNPSDNFGGTWELLTTGTKALYLDATAGTIINEELPNIKGGCNLELGGNSTRDGAMWSEQKAGNRSPNWNGSYSWAKLYFDASKYNSVYKDNGKVRAEGITICAWKRTA
jgi:hypothetical protein